MIGNDIVDLELAAQESNWKRKGFLEKLFTIKELQLIRDSDSPEIMVWNLWSRKEAAYKIFNRQSKITAFIPLRLECFNLDSTNNQTLGEVRGMGNSYFTNTLINPEYVYSVAVGYLKDFGKIIDAKNINISKDFDGLPYDHSNGKPVSITHHGRFEKKILLNCDS